MRVNDKRTQCTTVTDQEIQNALYQLFKSSPQGQISIQDNQGPQGQSILTTQLPQGEIQSMNEDSGPQGTISSILAPTAISKI